MYLIPSILISLLERGHHWGLGPDPPTHYGALDFSLSHNHRLPQWPSPTPTMTLNVLLSMCMLTYFVWCVLYNVLWEFCINRLSCVVEFSCSIAVVVLHHTTLSHILMTLNDFLFLLIHGVSCSCALVFTLPCMLCDAQCSLRVLYKCGLHVLLSSVV